MSHHDRIRAYFHTSKNKNYVDFEQTDIESWEFIDDQHPRYVKLKGNPKLYLIHSWVYIDKDGNIV